MDQLTGAADAGELLHEEAKLDAQARTSETGRQFGLLLVDLIGLRVLNSNFGRTTGDEVLVELARRLQTLYPQACVARVEADKFAVLIDGLSHAEAALEGRQLKHDLNAASWQVDGKSISAKVRITSVVGPSRFPGETHLLWTAQRIHRAKAQWHLEEKVKELEDLARLNGLQAELGQFRAELAVSISERDPLTGALNFGGFVEILSTLETPFALAFVDVDNLRNLNDVEGENWEAGNRALIGVKRLLESISPTGIVARWGGDEFAMCLPGFTASSAGVALNALLEQPERQLRIGDLPVTFSGGVTTVTADDDRSLAMKRAQQRAKDSKAAGRSRILIAE